MQEDTYKYTSIKLCKDCIHCKVRFKEVYCKEGFWQEKFIPNRSILHSPTDFECRHYED
jgi:hypothetical protein